MEKILISMITVVSLFAATVSAADKPQQVIPDTKNSQTAITEGSVLIDKIKIDYQAQTGILELNSNDPDDPTIGMFYVAYFKKDQNKQQNRPITFIYNGGPGSASLWLHMGAFGPQRVITPQPEGPQLASYKITNNQYSLLNVSDLVFIDAPGTGYSRFTSTAKTSQDRTQQKSQIANDVYGVNADALTFAQFIVQFLTKTQRWNSPKYLLGESYGTTRSVMLAEALKEQHIDLNGIVLMSQYLNYDDSIDNPNLNPGIDQPYYLALPTYAASAWYYHRLPNMHQDLPTLLSQAEQFAMGPYSQALQQGANLSEKDREKIAQQLYQFTSIPADYWLKADLRLTGTRFTQQLLADRNETIGRLDTRYHGPSLDNLNSTADYDPDEYIITSAYVALFHDYLAKTLKFSASENYQAFSDAISHWNMFNNEPARSFNVLPDLARVMKTTPGIRVMVIGGIYDLATPWLTAKYEMSHLPIPANLRKNIVFSWYKTGHMPYVDEPSLQEMHNNLSAFISQKN